MDGFESLGDPKNLFKYLITTIAAIMAMITLFIFTMDKELKIYFYILLVMLVIFMLLLIYLSPIIFADSKSIKKADFDNNQKEEIIEKQGEEKKLKKE